jgi:citrate lyase subunit beta/citryl-CoA lyase
MTKASDEGELPAKGRVGATARRVGAAGRRGEGVRSDLWVSVQPRETDGIEISLESRVEPYYGEAIRGQIIALLETLGVTGAVVEVDDTGALPFVIAARVETAVQRSGVELSGDGRPALGVDLPDASARDRLRRSRLYLPGNEPKFFVSAGLYEPDGIILDLEDSVHPDEKDAARTLVRNALRAVDFKTAERMVRINQLPLGLEDLEAIVPERPDLILIPKTEAAEQVREVDARVTQLLASESGLASDDRPVWLMPILETALGIEGAFEIARASERVVALTIGLEDYAADLGVPRSADGAESMYARTRLINAAKAAGVQAIDSVYGQVDDLEGLREWGEGGRRLGFEGMGCVHPRQIPVIHDAFAPTPSEVERARRIVAAFEEARAEGLGVVSLGSKMIDPPVVRQALRVVDRARAAGLEPLAGGEDDPRPGASLGRTEDSRS